MLDLKLWIVFAPEDKLAPDKMMVKFSPKDPGVDEDVTFSVHLNYSTVSIVYYYIQVKF